MKTIKIALIVLFSISFSTIILAQKKSNTETIKIKTSAECEQCKERLEKAMAYEKGVKKSNLDIESRILTVTFNSKKTNEEKIKQVIVNNGYDADDMPANNKAYQKLPNCCKKDGHQ